MPVNARGVCWSTSPNPTIKDSSTCDGTGTGAFTSKLSRLQPNTTYYLRAYATNKYGTNYGSQINFKTLESKFGTFTDTRDGFVYKTVKIGNQVWLAENLRYLPNIISPITDPDYSYNKAYYYVYGYTGTNVDEAKATSNYKTYGVLYNWFAAMSGSASSSKNPSGVKGIAPEGWHIPSQAEWEELIAFLGGGAIAGPKLKETGTIHWLTPNTGSTNESGFSALPGGFRQFSGSFININEYANFWCSNNLSGFNDAAWQVSINYYFTSAGFIYNTNEAALSIRCIKDNL